MLGEGSKQLAQAVQTQLHDAPVSRRPVTMHCFSITEDVMSMAEEVGHNSSRCSSYLYMEVMEAGSAGTEGFPNEHS